MTLTSKSAIVVGSGGPVGRACCARLAAEGARVVAIGWDDHGVPAGAATAVRLSWSDRGAMEAMLGKIMADHSPVAVVVFVGIESVSSGSILDCGIDTFDAAVSQNLGTLFVAMRRLLPDLVARGQGTFAVVCPITALNGIAGRAASVGCDHAALGLVRAAAMDVAADGVTVNAICHPLDPAEDDDIPLAIADALIFLASPLARSVTGTQFVIDRGQSVRIAAPTATSGS